MDTQRDRAEGENEWLWYSDDDNWEREREWEKTSVELIWEAEEYRTGGYLGKCFMIFRVHPFLAAFDRCVTAFLFSFILDISHFPR